MQKKRSGDGLRRGSRRRLRHSPDGISCSAPL